MIGIVKGLMGASFVPPVGFVWKSASSTSPASIYAGTVWTSLKDRAILAAGGSYGNGSTGGRSSVALGVNEMPAHGHSGNTSSNGSHTHQFTVQQTSQTTLEFTNFMTGTHTLALVTDAYTSTDGEHAHTASMAATGGGQAFSILNPYAVRYMWERIG